MDNDLFFLLGFSLLLTHELDAIHRHEWRMFPLTAPLDDRAGYLVFTAAHVPLLALLLAGLTRVEPSAGRSALETGLDLFFVVHLLLHILFLKHPQNQFTSLFSWALIAGAGVCGLADLLLRQ